MSPTVRSIAVVGAGPAGTLAAIKLARQGFQVTLIEQKTFPRDKVCGECLSALGLHVLEQNGLLDLLKHAGLHTLSGGQVHGQCDATLLLDLPATMGGISRGTMDQLLLDAAREAGATVRQPARFERGQLRDLATNRVEALNVDLVIKADGKPHDHARPTGQFGIKTHFRGINLDAQAIHLFSAGRNYGGIARVENGLWNAAFVVDAAHLKSFAGDIDRLFHSIVCTTPALSRAMRVATQTHEWFSCPLPRYAVESEWQPDEIPVGNAAAALEPIGGEGMGLALASSAMACDEVTRACNERRAINTRRLRQEFNRLWRVRRFASRASGLLLSHPRLVDIALHLIGTTPMMQRTLLQAVGK